MNAPSQPTTIQVLTVPVGVDYTDLNTEFAQAVIRQLQYWMIPENGMEVVLALDTICIDAKFHLVAYGLIEDKPGKLKLTVFGKQMLMFYEI